MSKEFKLTYDPDCRVPATLEEVAGMERPPHMTMERIGTMRNDMYQSLLSNILKKIHSAARDGVGNMTFAADITGNIVISGHADGYPGLPTRNRVAPDVHVREYARLEDMFKVASELRRRGFYVSATRTEGASGIWHTFYVYWDGTFGSKTI